MTMNEKGFFNPRIDSAITFATYAHRKQVRKTEGDMPYICHPVSVGLTLQSAGFDDDTIIAGLLHDTIEDTGTTGKEIEEAFGRDVRLLVQSVSEDKSLPWEERKNAYMKVVLDATDERTKAISVADKIQNVNSLLNNVKASRQDFWSKFTRGKDVVVGHYLESAEAMVENWPHPLSSQLLELARELKQLSQS
jgi:(p)ppGpp synthase/HD superfamily hydrolase